MARCPTRALCGGEPGGTTGLAAGIGRDARVEAMQKRLVDARQAPSGVAFLLYPRAPCPRPSGRLRRPRRSCGAVIIFLLATQEKSDSVAAGDRPLLTLNAPRARASRTEPAPRLDPGCVPTGRQKPPPVRKPRVLRTGKRDRGQMEKATAGASLRRICSRPYGPLVEAALRPPQPTPPHPRQRESASAPPHRSRRARSLPPRRWHMSVGWRYPPAAS